jgi:hypothetical protein
MDAVRRTMHPEFVFHPIRAEVTGDYVGHAGLEEFLTDNAETFDRFHIEYDEIRELEDGRILAVGTVAIRGRGSQVVTKVASAGIGTFRDGLPASWYDYGERTTALAAAGLRPE